MVAIINLEEARRPASIAERVASLIIEHDADVAAYERSLEYKQMAHDAGNAELELHFAESALKAIGRARKSLDEANKLAESL